MEQIQKAPGILKLLWFVYKKYYSEKRFARHMWITILFELLSYVYPLLSSFLLAKVVDKVIQIINVKGSIVDVLPTMGLMVASFLIWTIVENFSQRISGLLSMWRPYVEDDLYAGRYMQIEPKAYEDPKFVEYRNAISWNSNAVGSAVFNAVSLAAMIPAVIISLLAILRVNWVLALFAVLAAIPTAIIIKTFGGKVWGIWADKGEDKIRYYLYREAIMGQNPERHQEVYVFGYGKYLLEKAKEINRNFTKKLEENDKKRYFWTGISSIISILIYLAAVLLTVNSVIDGQISVGMLTFIISAYDLFNGNVSRALNYASRISADKSLLEKFYFIQNWKNEIQGGEKRIPTTSNGVEIEFRNVWFKYPDTEKWIFKELCLKIDTDEDIAIVGKNGAGKTTLIKLLLRTYDVDRGEILVNGTNIKEYNLRDYHKYISILSQAFVHLGITASENIMVGDVFSKKSADRIKDSAIRADIHDVIKKWPKGYATFTSREVKQGVVPSGGQWQKLSIARAFYRDAKLLILDEPTSAVDALSEEKIFDNIRENAKNKTTLIVSHRFATVRKAKRIIVIDNGKIVEDGKHEDLMKQDGLYAKMYRTQVEKA